MATSTNGVRIYIGTQAASPSGDTFEEIGEITNFGDFGDTAEIITYKTLADARTHKLQGTKDAGDFELSFVNLPDDDGQADLKAAFESAQGGGYNFRVEVDNAPGSGVGAHGDWYEFKGIVTGFKYKAGENDQVISVTATIAIDSAVTFTAGVAGS
jgi:hypothetical protein